MSKILSKPYRVPIVKLALLLVLVSGFSTLIASPLHSVSAGFEVFSEADFGADHALNLAAASDFGIGQAPASSPSVTVGYESLYSTLVIMVIVLVIVILLLLFISANIVNLIRVREGKESHTLAGTLAMTKAYALNPYIASVGTLVIVVIGLFIATPIARGVGLSKGYQPDQPIWFSHKIHAGTYKIDCQFCHSGASKGKNSWIPAVTVCMNCHKGITEGKKTGTAEIEKIYKAFNNNLPIEWVRVHNLPDFAYFNHQQHVVAGKLECQECHGPVEEMDVLYQYSNLSMGWCINCHRTKAVDAELYKALDREDVHTPADGGGTDCARCHY